jgi:hypothetical protein
MEPRLTLDRLEALLIEERTAIRTLDTEAVAASADEKERLFAALTSAPKAELATLAPRIRELSQALRHNGILLAHARDCVRDALATALPAGAFSDRQPNPFQIGRPPRRLSARG